MKKMLAARTTAAKCPASKIRVLKAPTNRVYSARQRCKHEKMLAARTTAAKCLASKIRVLKALAFFKWGW
jgi:hypothetical protein